MINELGDLKSKLIELEQRIYVLENKQPSPWYQPMAPQKSRSCSKCGLTPDGIWGYVCPNMDCPLGMGPTVC